MKNAQHVLKVTVKLVFTVIDHRQQLEKMPLYCMRWLCCNEEWITIYQIQNEIHCELIIIKPLKVT